MKMQIIRKTVRKQEKQTEGKIPALDCLKKEDARRGKSLQYTNVSVEIVQMYVQIVQMY